MIQQAEEGVSVKVMRMSGTLPSGMEPLKAIGDQSHVPPKGL